ncbi:Outer membrane lipoprotein Omp16 homolog [Candidatus Terasakiella magnetica]|uniref:Peptidoglycan-associated lipoprotein n=1 Tax=Candidatus Terasakiella magnetica TaxID=1867952 RepID=A0A1C3RHP0_9PROT|nr:peptidoglycan-associated lipoprotein Pal [Candidatus Terasakiella magnetica]SCA56803.1 Outer membrane lipoprotein Omp16 homolog [Candidatus Terasakiella magnetica]
MRKFLGLVGAVALLAACETAPQDGANASGAAAAQKLGPASGTAQDFVVNVGDRVFFGFDQYNLTADARSTLEKQAMWLKKYPNATIALEGHCDERGTREYNLALGERRANAAKEFLVSLGVDAMRVKTISFGKERPVALGHNEAAWAQNRRSVTVVSMGAGS